MRIAGLIVLAILLSAPAHAAALININTADAVTLQTLPGIGAVKATAIIDYRTANGLFARIEDIQKVSGIGNGVTYANIAPLITVGTASVPPAPVEATSTFSVSSSGSASTYVPPPSTLSLDAGGNRDALVEAPLRLSARVTTKGGAPDTTALVIWSFGDGSSAEGGAVEKIYRYPGTYLVMINASDGQAKARDEVVVTVRSAQLRQLVLSKDGITITNDASQRLDLSGWRLMSESGSFRIPDGTFILPKASVLFPFAIINMSVSLDATLTYPNGVVAARSAPAAAQVPSAGAPAMTASAPLMQLSEPATSSQKKQTSEPATSISLSGTAHENTAVSAPAATKKLAAAGAALLVVKNAPQASPAPQLAQATTTRASDGIFKSPWTLSFLGVMTLAGGAFILL